MTYTGPIIAVVFIVIVARLLLKKFYPHAVLLVAGLLMLLTAYFLGQDINPLRQPTGYFGFDLFRYIKESFADTNAGVGLLIMAIGGFVAYIDHIGASATLVHLAMRPLGLLRKYPHMAASAVIPIGQLLFIAIPSAAGLSLLLMASIYPILTNLGVSRLSAVSVITACTAIGLGPASAMSASAADIMSMPLVDYFVGFQFPLLLPLSIVLTITYFFVNRYFDKKDEEDKVEEAKTDDNTRSKAPSIYALIPVLPIFILLFFSEFNTLFEDPVSLDTTTAMLISLFVAMMFEWVRHRKLRPVLESLKVYWNGMGNIFKTVVTLIIAADIFSRGLIALGFIDGLLAGTQHLGLGVIGVGVVMAVLIFLASMLMGSGNAAFFAFGPLVPDIAAKFGVKSTFIILPMNFAASMGRTISPIAGVLIASAELAGVTTFQIVKRNLIPVVSALVVMLIYHFL
jgi:DcuC family C4-dicarboxylate transporter